MKLSLCFKYYVEKLLSKLVLNALKSGRQDNSNMLKLNLKLKENLPYWKLRELKQFAVERIKK